MGSIGQFIGPRVSIGILPLIVLAVGFSTGCQITPAVSTTRLTKHREMTDLSGLDAARMISELKVSWAVPDDWVALPLRKTALFTHQQWRSRTLATGVGVAHVELPIPIPTKAVLWFAKNEYMRRSKESQANGRLIQQWTDALGREWFEAENSTYHIRGYAMTRGNEAWIVYWGRRVAKELQPSEIALAHRSVDSVVPMN